MSEERVSVLFVCLGNICRSPTAEGVFSAMAQARGLAQQLLIDSAGTSSWHIDSAPDARTQVAAANRGYDLSALRGRQVSPRDFERFDYILAMDHSNLAHLTAMAPNGFSGHLGLMLEFGTSSVEEVPDPYHGGAAGFENVLDLLEESCAHLLDDIERRLNKAR